MARQGASPDRGTPLPPASPGVPPTTARRAWRGPLIAGDGRCVHAAGGSEAQELAFALGNAVAYLRALEKHGVALDAARRLIFFRLAADADEFLTIAKFRALRKLWARVEQASGLKPEPAFVVRRDRVAHDDAARPLREHAAHDDRGHRRRRRWRRRDHRAALHAGASVCPTVSRGASRATCS